MYVLKISTNHTVFEIWFVWCSFNTHLLIFFMLLIDDVLAVGIKMYNFDTLNLKYYGSEKL